MFELNLNNFAAQNTATQKKPPSLHSTVSGFQVRHQTTKNSLFLIGLILLIACSALGISTNIAKADCIGSLRSNPVSNLYYSPDTQKFGVATALMNCFPRDVAPLGTSITYSSTAIMSSQTSTASSANTYYGAGLTLKAGTAPGLYSVTVTHNADAGGRYTASPSSTTVSFNVYEAFQIINFTAPADNNYTLNIPISLKATGGASGNPVIFTSNDTNICTIFMGSFVIPRQRGICSITASQTGNINYEAAKSVTKTFSTGSAEKAPQIISFTAPEDQLFTLGGSVDLFATGGASGSPVKFTSNSIGICTVSGTTVTMVSTGTCSITASQAGDATYLAAKDVIDTFSIDKAEQEIVATASRLVIEINGTSTILTSNGGAGAGVLSYEITNGNSFCTLFEATITGIAQGTCAITVTKAADYVYKKATATFTINVSKIAMGIRLNASSSSLKLMEPVTYTATLAPISSPSIRSNQLAAFSPKPTLPSGTVTFTDGADTLCANVPVIGQTAQCTTSFTSPGTHNVMASYGGDATASATSTTSSAAVANTVEDTNLVAARFSSQRANSILTNQFSSSRQVGRLNAAKNARSGETSGNTDAGSNNFSQEMSTSASLVSRFGDGLSGQQMSNTHLAAHGFEGKLISQASNSIKNLLQTTANGNPTFRTHFNEGGIQVSGEISQTSNLSFSTSLSSIRKAKAKKQNERFALNGSRSNSFKQPFSPFDIWVEGTYSNFKDNGGFNGHFGMLTVGADYVFNPSFLFGIFAQFDSMQQSSNAQPSHTEGTGWMIGPYTTLRLGDNLFWQARAAWGKSTNEISPYGTYTDNFKSSRWLVSSTLSGDYQQGNWKFSPSVSLSYFEDNAGSYLNQFNVLMPSLTTRLGSLKAGPTLSYGFELTPDLKIETKVEAQLIWNFAGGTTASGTGIIANPSDTVNGIRGRLGLGVSATSASGIRSNLTASYDGIGSRDYSALSVLFNVQFPMN